MLSQIEAADRPVSCVNTICLLRKVAIHCGCSVGRSGLIADIEMEAVLLLHYHLHLIKKTPAECCSGPLWWL